ncbi:MAG: Wzz/FepE/Etk N-terminal domain-containing protein [bacterium]
MADKVNKEQEIDLIKLIKDLWQRRKTIFIWCGVGVAFALIIAFSIPRGYTSETTLVPESSSSGSQLGNLGGIASMMGVNLGSSAGADAISVILYPDVVASIPFMTSLFPMEVNSIDGEISTDLYTYMLEYQKKSWWRYIIDVPKSMISRFIKWISAEESIEGSGENGVNIEFLTKKEDKVLELLNEAISIEVNQNNGIVTVSVEMQDPQIAFHVAKEVTQKLQYYITNYRTQKSKEDMEYAKEVYITSQAEYYKLQNAYAAYIDENRNITSSLFRVEQERLQNEMSLSYSVYSNLAANYETAKLKVQEQTPVYTIVNPPTIPLRASSPSKMLILVVFVFLSGCASVVYLIIKDKLLGYLYSTSDNAEITKD